MSRRFNRETDHRPGSGAPDADAARTLVVLDQGDVANLSANSREQRSLEQELADRRRRQELAERTLRTVTLDLLERAKAAEADRDRAVWERDHLRRHLATQAIIIDPAGPQEQRRALDARVLRIVAIVALVVGILAVVDAFLTIVWQEPLSGLFAQGQQDALSRDLAATASAFALPAIAPRRTAARESRTVRVRRAAARLLEGIKPGRALGSLRIPKLGLSTVIIEGTSADDLRKAPGHYRSTMLPGLPGTVAIAGHRTTFGAPFRHVDRLKPGDRIVMRMPYGTFTYRVDRTRIVDPSAVWPLIRRTGPGRLVLTACHPVGSAAQRILVSAARV